MSPKRAASSAVAACARSPSCVSRSRSESGPRELLMATSWPAFTKCCASVEPMWPAPIIPIFMGLSLLPGSSQLIPSLPVLRISGSSRALDDLGRELTDALQHDIRHRENVVAHGGVRVGDRDK